MQQHEIESLLDLIRSEIVPATGCTEPAAAALCAAAASRELGLPPQALEVEVSDYILKNAMNVGIPGTQDIGLPIAIALGALSADPGKGLSVLSELSGEQHTAAQALCPHVKIDMAKEAPKIYIRVIARAGNHSGEAVIAHSHTNIVRLARDGVSSMEKDRPASESEASAAAPVALDLRMIWDFAQTVSADQLAFLNDLVSLNADISREGLTHAYGLQVGQKMLEGARLGLIAEDTANYAVAVTAAAADARMAGCEKAVMSVAGSGNQGLTATLPLIAVAEKNGCSTQTLLRSLAISILVTIHVKTYIGRLSVLCGCGVASAIGVTAGLVYMYGGTLAQAEMGIRTMTADIAGMVCDGAKPGCALKIATSVSASMRAATLALSGVGATGHDGIVSDAIECTLQNLGDLGTKGLSDANHVILNMLLNKQDAETKEGGFPA